MNYNSAAAVDEYYKKQSRAIIHLTDGSTLYGKISKNTVGDPLSSVEIEMQDVNGNYINQILVVVKNTIDRIRPFGELTSI